MAEPPYWSACPNCGTQANLGGHHCYTCTVNGLDKAPTCESCQCGPSPTFILIFALVGIAVVGLVRCFHG